MLKVLQYVYFVPYTLYFEGLIEPEGANIVQIRLPDITFCHYCISL